jgi:hypothetical protein
LTPPSLLRGLALAMAVGATLLLAAPAGAATIAVNTTTDETTPGDGFCSLQEAVGTADFNSAGGDCTQGDAGSLDTIQLGSGTFTVNSGLLLQNVADTGGVELVGAGRLATTIHAGTTINDHLLATQSHSALTVQDLTLDNGGGASIFGGGLESNTTSLTLTRAGVTNNTGAFGAGVYFQPDTANFPNAALTITDSVIDSNTASPGAFSNAAGGGILTQGKTVITGTAITNNHIVASGMNNDGDGGGVHTDFTADLTLTGDLISGNTVSATRNALGGGVKATGNLTAVNDTFTGNTVTGGVAHRGGALSTGSPSAALTDVTIAGNNATTAPAIDHGNPVTLLNSIIDDGSAACGGSPVTTLGGNIDHGADCWIAGATGDLQSTDPVLGSLANNGGNTFTMALLAGSPAVDHVPTGSCVDQQSPTPQPVTRDQRGVMRPQGSACESGAFELEAATPPPPGGGTGGGSGTPPTTTTPQPGPTGLQAEALRKCKEKRTPAKRRKCRKRARLLPV